MHQMMMFGRMPYHLTDILGHHKEGKLVPILSKESIEWLDQYIDGWMDIEKSGPALAGSVASGKVAEDCSIEELRTALFMEQRSTRNSAIWAEDENTIWSETRYAREIIKEIRDKYDLRKM